MQTLKVFASVSLDGFFTDARQDLSWAQRNDPEWLGFVGQNASGGGTLMFGRKTYEEMASFWPTAQAKQAMPETAAGMNALSKTVFSRTLQSVSWGNTTLLRGDLIENVRRLKQASGEGLVILGSGSLVAQLTEAGLVDEYQLVIVPVVLGAGRTLFEGVKRRVELERTDHRAFTNGNIVVTYRPKP